VDGLADDAAWITGSGAPAGSPVRARAAKSMPRALSSVGNVDADVACLYDVLWPVPLTVL